MLNETVLAVMGDYGGIAPPDLLVVKTFDAHPTELADLCGKRLIVSDAEATLLDVAPTITALTGVGDEMDFDGVPLIPLENAPRNRERFYYMFDKKGPNEWTDEMVRYRIDASGPKRMGVIRLTNNPPG